VLPHLRPDIPDGKSRRAGCSTFHDRKTFVFLSKKKQTEKIKNQKHNEEPFANLSILGHNFNNA